jgi:RNA polymerase sigma-70 factor (ECF subfamily)
VNAEDLQEAITQAHREEWARVVASLARRFGDLDVAEEAAAEAFATAVQRWPVDGVPPSPGAWLTTTANRKAIDRIRRESKRSGKQQEAQMLYDDDLPGPGPATVIDDERLRLIFTCCHPALAMQTRVALTLRMVAGLTVPEIARAFLVAETAIGQRITRAKAKIKAARIPYRVPSAEDLPARVSGVLTVLFLVFNEGYLATGPGIDPVRQDLTGEAIRLTRLIRSLMPDDGEVAGLLAMMLLIEARRTARVSASGELVSLGEQDRGAWDGVLIAEGHRLVRERLAAGAAPGPYQILAAINAVHTSARDVRDTDWSQVVALYDQLVRLDRSPVIALNRAVAIGELDGPEVALAAVDRLEDKLAGYHAYHAAHADLLRRLGRSDQARAAYGRAIELAGNTAEIAFLTRRRDQLELRLAERGHVGRAPRAVEGGLPWPVDAEVAEPPPPGNCLQPAAFGRLSGTRRAKVQVDRIGTRRGDVLEQGPQCRLPLVGDHLGTRLGVVARH